MSEETKKTSPQETPSPGPEQTPAAGNKKADKPLTPGQQRRRQKSVFQYIAILFGAAFVLLLFTFLMERRQYQLLQEQNAAQIDDLQQSVNAVQSLNSLYEENAALKEKTQDLEEQTQALQEQVDQLQQQVADLSEQAEKTSQAMDWFWQINEAYVRGRYTLCRQLMESLEEAGLKEWLPKESITDNDRFSPYDRYQEIYDALF